ncbi:MAG: glutamate--tRNA ligase [Pedosphaera sp.]|nr:glutamate--tRNA ligase [Pedosphaera sp.]
MSVRVRFAPSPTGYLHIGGARTALFNWLYARHTGGTFILRIEDTDEARNSQAAVDIILHGLRWLGLDWDEGPTTGAADGPSKGSHGPYFQSQRKAIYQKRVQELKEKNLAYEHEGAVKFRMTREPILIPDCVVGDVTRVLTDREELDPDFVISRSDGQPVFHLVNVIDDLEMGITHVIRGEDHLSNTSKHIALFRAFGAESPQYAHIPLILNSDGSKMSKRDAGASMATYIDGNYDPAAVINFLSLLGWSPKDDRQLLSAAELVQLFDLPQVLRHNARFDIEKLNWFNYEHLRTTPIQRYAALAQAALRGSGIDLSQFPASYVEAALQTCRDKVKQLPELPAFCDFYFKDEFPYDTVAAEKHFVAAARPIVEQTRAGLAAATTFDAASVEALFKSITATAGVKVGVLVHPVRLACTGRTIGPSLYHLIEVLGRERVLQRLGRALERMK